jgi:VWFA-related protein
MDRRPRVVSNAPYVLAGIAVLFLVCAAVGRAVPNLHGTSQTPAVDPTTPVWLIFIDDLHLDFPATGRLKDLFKKVTAELVHAGDAFAVVSTGPAAIAIDLTADRGQLTHALNRIAGAALKPSEILDPTSDMEVRYRAHVAFGTAYSVLKTLAVVPNKRKAFIYISNGYYFDVGPSTSPDTIRENPFLAARNEVSLDRLRAEVAELTRQATRSRVTVFSIDPRGLSELPTIQPNVRDAVWQQYWTTTRRSLQVLSEQTGGRLIQDDLDGNLKRIVSAIR